MLPISIKTLLIIYKTLLVHYVAVAALLAFVDDRQQRLPETPRPWLTTAFLLASWMLVFTTRIPFFSYDQILNPDEALFAANALRSRYGWVNWGTIDPTTSGPLNSIVLTWPYLFGGDITLYSGRLTATVLVCATIGLFYATARELSGFTWSLVSVTPLVLCLAFLLAPDFVQFSSEHLPVFLIALAIFLLVRAINRFAFMDLVLAAFVLGLVPFAKLQGIILAFVIGLFVLLRSITTRSARIGTWERVSLVLLAAVLPAAVFLIPLAASGEFDDFVNSYILLPLLRPRGGGPTVLQIVREVGPFHALCLAVLAAIGVASVSFAINWSKRSPLTDAQRWTLWLSLAVLPAAYLSIAFTAHGYVHYLQFGIIGLALVLIVTMSALSTLRVPRWQTNVSIGLVCVLCIWPLLRSAKQQTAFIVRNTISKWAFHTGELFAVPRPYSWLRLRKDDSIVCWGWRPQCYVDNAMPSATRDGTNESQLYDTALQPYFRARFMKDFVRSRPDFLIDDVAPGSFAFNIMAPATDFPALSRVIETEFTLVSRVVPPDRCPRLYVRKSRLIELSKSMIEFERISGPASDAMHAPTTVDDGSIFESCDDFWLLPYNTTGSLTITFREPSAVRTLAILNTRNGSVGDRSTRRIRLTFLRLNQPVHEEELDLEPFPRWTTATLSPLVEQADSVRIDIISFNGAGGGLNEVKLYRD